MRIHVLDVRVWLVVFVLAIGVMLAGHYGKAIFDPSRSAHEQGAYQFPKSDCGDNFFLFTMLPGNVCIERGDKAEKVEAEMERQDPAIFDESLDYVTAERWHRVVIQALRALGWNLP